ncbi:conserved hypothetical protein [Coccidioides posadasii str. Silveira]|uniref:Uncharacterized protein n=1 Tax=Coccidioides posadasii (strain RMSCC 757 / Silveira) TaxID=443226 RepID=E9DEC6_COCPS|nr:conserved hypothetical protein [Coccidioides posadasii str. Silveira]
MGCGRPCNGAGLSQPVEDLLYVFVDLQNTLDTVPVECGSSEPPGMIKEGLLESESDEIEHESPPSPAESSSSENDPAPLLTSSGLSSPGTPGPRLDHGPFLPTNTVESTEEDNTLAQELVAQLQTHHGCSTEAHAASEPLSMPTVSLSQMASWECPDVLEHASMSSYSIQWDTILPVHQHQRLYSGISASVESLVHEEVPSCPATIDLEGDTMLMPASLHAMIDIDSAGGLASSLTVACEGFQWKVNQSLMSNLKSSLHLDPISVQWRDEQTERVHQSQRSVHQIPHLLFGQLVGFPEIEVYILFPWLFSPQCQHHIITEQEYALWTDKIFLPALHHVYSASTLLHLSSSAVYIQLSSTAAWAEGCNQTLHKQPQVQEFHFLLQPAELHHLWKHVQIIIQDPGLQHFQRLMLLLTAKNLKLSTQHAIWSSTRDAFFCMWNQAMDGRYLTTSFYNIGKEVYRVTSKASDSSHVQHGLVELALRSEDEDAYQPELSEGSEDEDDEDASNLGEHSAGGAPVADAQAPDSEHEHPQEGFWHKQFYPLLFLYDLGSMTLELHWCSPLHHQGLLYCQFYNTIKEVFMAGQHFLFANENLDMLALDPGLVQTWQHIGKAISHSPLALLRAYIHTKQQCHVAISDCRQWFYGTQENSGLWLDCQVQLPPEGSDMEWIQKGLGMAFTLELYGYAWFLDKLDWMAMTFKPSHRAHMVFNTPTLQMAYYWQYWQLIKFKSDFMLFHDVFSCMLDVCLDPAHSALLLQLLVNLCLRAFWKDVFRSLADCVIQQPLHPARLENACNGEIPLTCAGISQIFQHSHFWKDIQFITGFRMKVRNIEMLFAWLWGWDSNGNSNWLCKHWESKQYWVLFHQFFNVIVSVYRTQQACEWCTIVKQTFIHSHWILFYPSTAAFWAHGKRGKLQSWASTHSGLVNYLQQYQPELTIIEPDMIDELSLADWKAGGQPLPLDVALPSVPSNLDAWLAIEQGQHPVPAAMSLNPAVFLLAVGKEGKSASQLHTNCKWLTSQLVLHIQALVEAERQQVQSMDLSRATQSWQSCSQAQPNSNLTLVGPRMTRMDLEEDSDPESLNCHEGISVQSCRERPNGVSGESVGV